MYSVAQREKNYANVIFYVPLEDQNKSRDDREIFLLEMPEEKALEEVLSKEHNDLFSFVISSSVNVVKGCLSEDCIVFVCSICK